MTHVREHRSILAAAEKRLLIFIAERLPRAIHSDHLTSLALALLIAYLLVAGEVFLAAAVRGVFTLSAGGIGPTELRIILAAGAVALMRDPHVSIGPLTIRLFDFGGALAASGLLVVFVVSVLRNTTALAVAEPR